MTHTNDQDCDCKCCPGPTGPQGPQGVPGIGIQGAIGPQGIPGRDGRDGVDGKDGKNGVDGIRGPMGEKGEPGQPGSQGIQGIPGNCIECPCHCDEPEFAEVFSKTNQNLAASPGLNLPGQVVILENTVFATANIDVSNAGINGKIIINKAGWYDVATGICGYLNVIASPLPCWTLSLFRNGIYVPGSTFANQTISPEQKSNEIVADVFVHFNKGDVLELANTSTALVNMAAPVLGTNAPASSAYMKIVLLKAD